MWMFSFYIVFFLQDRELEIFKRIDSHARKCVSQASGVVHIHPLLCQIAALLLIIVACFIDLENEILLLHRFPHSPFVDFLRRAECGVDQFSPEAVESNGSRSVDIIARCN